MSAGVEPGKGASVHDVGYTSTATADEIAARLARAERIGVITHAKPDGDAVGSSLALVRSLRLLGKEAHAVYIGPWISKFDPLIGDTPVVHVRHGCFDEPSLANADCIAVVDTGSWNQVADAREWIRPRREDVVIIDHHAHGDGAMASMRLVDTRAAAAAELVAEVCRHLLDLPDARSLPLEVAEPIYLGLATDTGWFRHSNVTSAVFRLAADMVDCGVDHNRIFRLIEQSDAPARLALIGRALGSLEFLRDGRLAVMSLDARAISETHATPDELGGLTDLPQTVGSVRAVAVLTELEPALTKVSLRSKAVEPPERPVDVNLVAQRLGGGGHLHAAGAKIHAPLGEAKRRVIAALEDGLPS